MKIAAITTYPPSSRPQSDFAFRAVQRFLGNPDIHSLVVIADRLPGGPDSQPLDARLTIDRCWTYDAPLSAAEAVMSVRRHQPDVVWLNMQYTLFGPSLVTSFIGQFTVTALRAFRIPVVVLLHQLLEFTALSDAGLVVTPVMAKVIRTAGRFGARAMVGADRVLVMVPEYAESLAALNPRSEPQYVEQDLYLRERFRPIDHSKSNVLTFGYFGTYKRLEILLDAFEIVRQSIPDARLTVAGSDSSLSPGYLDSVRRRYSGRLTNVSIRGFVDGGTLTQLLYDANVVVITNKANPGSSSALRLAATSGRGILLPNVDLFASVAEDGWGAETYNLSSAQELAIRIVGVLSDPDRQTRLAERNYRRAAAFTDDFVRVHLDSFRSLAGAQKI